MIARIHYTLFDGSEDSIVLEGSFEDIRERAHAEVEKRNGSDPWSEILEDD